MSQSPGMSHREHEAAILGTLRRELGGQVRPLVRQCQQQRSRPENQAKIRTPWSSRSTTPLRPAGETKFIPELRVACKESAANRHHLGGFVSVKTTP